MGDKAMTIFWSILAGLTGAATLAVILSKSSQTSSVITAFGSAFNSILATVVAPVQQSSSAAALTTDASVFGGNAFGSSGSSSSNGGGLTIPGLGSGPLSPNFLGSLANTIVGGGSGGTGAGAASQSFIDSGTWSGV